MKKIEINISEEGLNRMLRAMKELLDEQAKAIEQRVYNRILNEIMTGGIMSKVIRRN